VPIFLSMAKSCKVQWRSHEIFPEEQIQGSGGQKSRPSGVQGKAPVGVWGRSLYEVYYEKNEDL